MLKRFEGTYIVLAIPGWIYWFGRVPEYTIKLKVAFTPVSIGDSVFFAWIIILRVLEHEGSVFKHPNVERIE